MISYESIFIILLYKYLLHEKIKNRRIKRNIVLLVEA